MTTDNVSGKWINFPWFYNQGMDHLIHSDDLPNLIGQGIGIAYCIQDEEDFIRLQNKSTTVRVRKEGIKYVLPTPAYFWGEQVKIKSKPELFASVNDFFWHHKDGKYYYRLKINNKIDKKRYDEMDLEVLSV